MTELNMVKGALIIKVFIPQIMAAIFAASPHITVGITIAYSAILIPQIQNGTDTVQITDTDAVWITSCVTLIMPLSAVISGLLMDAFGRLTVLKLSAIPNIIGWTVIALATNNDMLLIGRIITGFAIPWSSHAAYVYISEISSSNVRGALLGSISSIFTIGIIITYLKGFFVNWKLIAWISNAYTVVTLILILFIPESPQWLVSKNRMEQARKSLEWFNKYQTNSNQSVEEITKNELTALQTTQKQKEEKHQTHGKFKLFLLPIGYKPLAILTVLFFIQQFSGVHIVMMNAVYFFTAFGTNVDPYLASTYMAVGRFLTTIVYIWLMKRYPRRGIIMISGVGMAVCMAISGLFTKWIQEGSSEQTWVPLSMLILYFLFMAGVFSIPFTMISELFPLAIRGIASNLVFGISYIMMFGALQSHHPLENALGGLSGVQFLFALVSLIGIAFTFVCVPETHRKTLCEIEEYFLTRTCYVSSGCCKYEKDENTHL